MVLLDILELLTILAICYFAITQLCLPIWHGTRLFPYFKSPTTQLRHKLKEAEDDLEAERLSEVLEMKKRKYTTKETNDSK